jgi:glycosidase
MIITGCVNKPKPENNNLEMISIDPHAVYYQIFVRSFADSNSDGIGDLQGATEKLDYLADLGIEAIWLMPISPSPSYHGYDVTDYKDVHEDYGDLEDLKEFVAAAHEKGIKVIVDLVVNHSSKEHPWFKKALAGDPTYRDYYVWAHEDTNTSQLGEWGQQVWHGKGNNKYEGIFWEGMPDLNFDNPDLRKEMIEIGQYWLEEVKVDGFRLDAAKHIFSDTSSEASEGKNHAWWQEFRAEMEKVNQDVVLVGEVWDTTSVVAPYLNDGLTSTFNFDLSEKILETVQMEKDMGIISSLIRTRDYYNQISNGDYTDSIFITNHDIPRVMTQLNNNEDQAKMAASLLLTLPGNPFIYYGEETGFSGPKPDEEIREPFIWKNDMESEEQTNWQPNKHNNDFEKKSVEAQVEDEDSMLNHYKQMIHLRRSHGALIEGEIEKSQSTHQGIVVFKRNSETGSLLVIHNVSGQDESFLLSENDRIYKEIYFKSKDSINLEKDNKQISISVPAYSTLILAQDKN